MHFTRRSFFAATAVSTAVVCLTPAAFARSGKVFTRNGIAIGGTDPVAYFEQGKPVQGSAKHSLNWNGATWHFSSAANAAKFKADPEAYAPQYGGFCAYAMSRDYFAPTSPDAWRIVNGKLYLNYNRQIQSKWNKNISKYIKSANGHWRN